MIVRLDWFGQSRVANCLESQLVREWVPQPKDVLHKRPRVVAIGPLRHYGESWRGEGESELQLVAVMTTLVSRRAKMRLSRVNLTRPVQLALLVPSALNREGNRTLEPGVLACTWQ